MPRKRRTSQVALSPKQRRQAVLDIIVAGLVRMPEGLDLTAAPPNPSAPSPFKESAESSPKLADRP